MSLEFSETSKVVPNQYFLYLKLGKIAKSIFIDHPVFGFVALMFAYFYLRKANLNFEAITKFGGRLLQIHRRINAIVVEFDKLLSDYDIKWLEDYLGVEMHPVKHVSALLNVSRDQVGVPEVVSAYGYQGEGIKVAVVDSGINDSHPDIQGRVISRKDFTVVESSASVVSLQDIINYFKNLFVKKTPVTGPMLDGCGHGTWCAVAVAGNGPLYRGMAPKVALIDARVLGKDGYGSDAGVVKGMSWAASQGADIISLSLGSEGGPEDAASREANALAEDGIVVVIAAGNSGPKAKTIGSPGCAEKVITVGAVDKANCVTSYSSRGPVVDPNGKNLCKPDIVAPGGGVTNSGSCRYAPGVTSGKSADIKDNSCTVIDDRNVKYQKMSGTSMACPVVAGACALLLEATKLSGDVKNRCEILKTVIKDSAKKLAYNEDWQGAGLLNVPAAINKLKSIYGG